jgi:P pilus assembly chaperone PapD
MQLCINRVAKGVIATTAAMFCNGAAQASGVTPETSIVVLDLAEGEATRNVKNSESAATLLHTSIENVAQDQEQLLGLTPTSRLYSATCASL